MTVQQARQRAALAVALAVLAVLLLFMLAAGGLLSTALAPAELAAVAAALGGQAALLVVAAVVVAGLAVVLSQALVKRLVVAPAQLHDEARLLLHGSQKRQLTAAGGGAALAGLAGCINTLAQQRDQLQGDIDNAVARASHGVAVERNRLAALMSELTQSVVVCNLDGRVLLYNQRARQQVRALADTQAGGQLGGAGGAELIGLGRPIYTVLDRALVEHALAQVQQRLARGEPQPSAQFVTVTRGAQLLRVQLAPVRGAADVAAVPGRPAGAEAEADAQRTAPAGPAAPALTGFVLVLDNITRSHAQDAALDRLLQGLTEDTRSSLANLQAAAEMLGDAGLPAPLRERFIGVVRDEAQAMGRRLNELSAQGGGQSASRWPLDDMLGSDFVQGACQAVAQASGMRCGTLEVDAALWLRLDSFALLQALCALARRLHGEFDIKTLHLRLQPAGSGRAHLDMVWTGQAMSTETVMSWELDPLENSLGGPGASAAGGMAAGAAGLSVRDVAQRHGGEFWFERDRVRHQAFFRFLLQQAAGVPALQVSAAPPLAPGDARPEYYDFDLFAHTGSSAAMDERPLTELAYTVFDTETTGLNPSAGDEILQIGALRIVNGRLLRSECFDQLVDPRRDIPAAGIPIHGITPQMVAGQPDIRQVLPAFHAFAADTVLVAHNAAFDMRFLQLKEKATGLRFDQPVLDTLLLSALVHPAQESHALDALAARLGVQVVDRHTALGDAIVTAEVFQKLLPLLAGMGLHTLGQVRAAAQKTYLARIQY